MNSSLLKPGATLGVIGDNLSGCQIIKEAKQFGLNVGILTSLAESKIKQYTDFMLVGDLNDQALLKAFAQKCDVVTYATDDINPEIIKQLQQLTAVPQGTDLLEIVQDRALEHAFFDQINVNSVPYMTVIDIDDLYRASESIGYPAILKPIIKTAKDFQQLKIGTKNEIDLAQHLFGHGAYILESDIDYRHKFAVIATRANNGEIAQFPAIEYVETNDKMTVINDHFNDIEDAIAEMKRITQEISQNINYVGSFEVTFGFDENDTLYVCGIKPTTSAKGYIFSVGMNITEYRQHLRALAGIPLTHVEKYTDVILQSFNPADLQAVLQSQTTEENWQMNFEYQCLLIPTNDSQEVLKRLKNYNL